MFIEIKANDNSLRQRELVLGVGVNDANYIVKPKVNGKKLICPYYRRWSNMLARCYDDKYQDKNKSYKDCSVCSEWLIFSNFKNWMKNQDWQGKHLDKDLLIQGNRVYSPATCLFITKEINLLISSKALKGFIFDNHTNKYKASCRRNGKQVTIGRYLTEDLAKSAYIKFKIDTIKEVAMTQLEPIKSALLNYKIES